MDKEVMLKNIIITISILGILLSSFIYYYETVIINDPENSSFCDISSTFSCSSIYSSPYSKIMGIKISILGIIFYSLTLALSIKRKYVEFLFITSVFGFLFSLYLTLYVETVILKTYCIFCLISALLSILLLIFSLKYRRIIVNS